MIFVTVGTQKPYPRLIDMVAEWAETHPGTEVIIQSGTQDTPPPAGPLDVHETLEPEAFERCIRDAEVVIAHAGIGTILAARDAGVPVIVVPRRADLGEHRNDHQIDTADALAYLDGFYRADTSDQLAAAIDEARALPRSEVEGSVEERERLALYVREVIVRGQGLDQHQRERVDSR